jgi:hypothetical protein
MVWIRLAPGVALAIVTACAGHNAGPFNGDNRNLISRAEIEESRAPDALTVVRRLRGEFLSNRGRTSIMLDTPMLPVVYLDQVQLGGFETLATIPARDIAEIRLYRAWEASYKFGKDKSAGVVQVITLVPAPVIDSAQGDSLGVAQHRPLLGWP